MCCFSFIFRLCFFSVRFSIRFLKRKGKEVTCTLFYTEVPKIRTDSVRFGHFEPITYVAIFSCVLLTQMFNPVFSCVLEIERGR